MNLSLEAIEKIIEKAQTPADASLRIGKAEEICRSRHEIEMKETNTATRHNITILDIAAERMDLQGRCPHDATKYYPDASGGSDSYTECMVCGKNLSV